ncbi:unnamed protein product [Paramecium octaurelia]|uniref:Uncharacterized protein n=1 Tax=Paramecium octaurelia TaxID=43137 RepID=A0A8S1W8D2_PAROT|nr:unnamed protein product [Paramecium octaurelia]
MSRKCRSLNIWRNCTVTFDYLDLAAVIEEKKCLQMVNYHLHKDGQQPQTVNKKYLIMELSVTQCEAILMVSCFQSYLVLRDGIYLQEGHTIYLDIVDDFNTKKQY